MCHPNLGRVEGCVTNYDFGVPIIVFIVQHYALEFVMLIRTLEVEIYRYSFGLTTLKLRF